MLAGVLAQDHGVLGDAHIGGFHDLVGLGIGDDAVLMDAGLMGEGVGTHDGLGGRDGHAGDVAEELAGAVDLPGIDAGLRVVEVPAGINCHGQLFQAGVARPLADAVDGALDLGGAGLHAGQGVGDGHAQVVVAVNGDVHVLDAGHMRPQVGDQLRHLHGRGVAHGVGDVQGGGAGGHGVGVALGQERPLGTGGVLGGELNVIAQGLCIGHHLADALEHLLRGHLQLVLHVDFAGGQKHVDAGVPGSLHRVPGGVDVALGTAGQRGHGAVGHGPGNGLDALVVHGGGNGEARLDDVHAQLFQLLCHFDLLREIHAAARGLLAVSQGSVKNLDALHNLVPPAFQICPEKQKQLSSLRLKRRKL